MKNTSEYNYSNYISVCDKLLLSPGNCAAFCDVGLSEYINSWVVVRLDLNKHDTVFSF